MVENEGLNHLVKFDSPYSLGLPEQIVPKISQEEAIILEKNVSNLTEKELFSSVSLIAWLLVRGPSVLENLVQKQQESFKISNFDSLEDKSLADTRLAMSSIGLLQIKFTDKVLFTEA